MVAAPDDADPFLGEAPDDGMEVLTFLLLVFHVSARPGTVFPAFLGKLVEGLPEEVVAAHSSVDLVGFSALFGDGGHAGEGGHGGGIFAEGSVEREGREQARGEGLSGAGQGGKEVGLIGL